MFGTCLSRYNSPNKKLQFVELSESIWEVLERSCVFFVGDRALLGKCLGGIGEAFGG